MTPLLKLYFDICRFRKGPQDVPASAFLLGLTITAYATVGLLLFSIETDLLSAIFQVLIEGGMLLGFLYVTLVSAQLGTDALISSMAIPLLALTAGARGPQSAYIFLLMLMLWHVSVVANILRHALSKSYGFGLGLAIAYFVGTYQIMSALAPPTGGA